jgi:hypothetical protein
LAGWQHQVSIIPWPRPDFLGKCYLSNAKISQRKPLQPITLEQTIWFGWIAVSVFPTLLPIKPFSPVRILIATHFLVIWVDIPCPRKKDHRLDLPLALLGYDVLQQIGGLETIGPVVVMTRDD